MDVRQSMSRSSTDTSCSKSLTCMSKRLILSSLSDICQQRTFMPTKQLLLVQIPQQQLLYLPHSVHEQCVELPVVLSNSHELLQ
jgi:hypothetical protein